MRAKIRRPAAASKSRCASVSPREASISIGGTRIEAEGGPKMKDRFRTMRLSGVALVVVVSAVAGLTASAQAAPGAAARLSVRSTEYGKALFGPSGKVV